MQLLNDITQLESQYGAEAKAMLATFSNEAIGLLDDTEDLLVDAEASMGASDFNRLMRNMHTLKGISAQSGLKGLSAIVHQIEDDLVPYKGQESVDISDGIASFILFLDKLRPFIAILQSGGKNEAFDTIWNDIEIAFKALRSSLKNKKEPGVSPTTSRETTTPASEQVRSLGYNLEKEQFDHILKLLEEVLVKLFRKSDDSTVSGVVKMIQESIFSLITARTSPGRNLSNKMKRLVKETAEVLGKSVDFQVIGFDSRIDNNLLVALSECLGHMIKNGIDHGLESTDERGRQGKPSRSHLVLELRKQGDRTIVMLKDDGRGIDPDLVVRRALEKGVITPEDAAKMTTYEKQELIFRPGFSTKQTATEISGRGVGMDAVVHEVHRLGGKLTFESQVEQGTAFFMEFPAPYQFESMSLFRYGARTFAIPARFVRGLVLDRELVTLEFGTVLLQNSGEAFTLLHLSEIDKNPDLDRFRPLILLELAGAPCALMVDSYCGTQSIFLLPTVGGEGLPTYVRGASSDLHWGPIFCLDCVELERNLNRYIPRPEEDAPVVDIASAQATNPVEMPLSKEIGMKSFGAPLQGRKCNKQEIFNVLEGNPFVQRMSQLVEPLRNDPETAEAVLVYIANEVEEVKATMQPIDDIDELQYLLAIAYTNLKSKWIQYNTKMNYMIEAGREPTTLDIYRASSLTHLIDLIEPLTHPDAVRTITVTLGQTFRELNAAA